MFYDSNHVQLSPHLFANSATSAACCRRAHGCARLNWPAKMQRDTCARLRRRAFTRLLATASLLVLAAGPLPAQGQGGGVGRERKVKAAFLYKFLGYAEFPPSAFADAAAPLVIGVVGADELAGELGRIVSGRTVQARSLVVKVLREAEAGSGVHLLFIGGAEIDRVRAWLRLVQPASVLVVTELDQGLQHGSVINFLVVAEQVRFDVSLDAAERNNVTLSSRLLTVANHVIRRVP